ncbi:MAG TPA: class I SAM-dependent methyltransferase [Chloroflexota bacterium]|nr:class I SAM-dependent methyltransferase [Chloroflexota bacterium]
MRPEVVEKLLALNRHFYEANAVDFSQSRQGINPGFARVRELLPQPCPRLLDVGCGNGRFGQYAQQQAIGAYVGVDFSGSLLEVARAQVVGEFHGRDLTQPGCLNDLGQFDAIVCLAVLHHIPGRDNRRQLLAAMGERLGADGRLFLSTWQFATNPRQQRKIRPWSEISLSPADVEPGDYLLTWQRGDFAYRYACHIDAAAVTHLAVDAGLRVDQQFKSDGREGDLSLYTVLEK